MHVKISATIKYPYPDIVVTCGEEQFEDAESDTLLIIEVLSNSTEGYDRGKKFEAYQRIASFAEYVLVSQEPYRVGQFVREREQRWGYFEYRDAEDVLQLSSINCELTLKDIYLKVI